MKAIIITNSIKEVEWVHNWIGEKDWYKENYESQYATGPHMSYDKEWVWYIDPANKEDKEGICSKNTLRTTIEAHPGIAVYWLTGHEQEVDRHLRTL